MAVRSSATHHARFTFLHIARPDGVVFIALLLLTLGIGLYYGLGYENLPSDDPAASVIGARYIVENRSVHFANPLSPSLQNEFYSNLISTEYPIHVVLAQLLFLVGSDKILTVINNFMIPMFVFSGFGIYLLVFELTKNRVLSLFGVASILLSRWYGLTFWTGHYAQMLAYAIIPLILLGLVRFENQKQQRWLVMSLVLTILLFPIHSLSFLVAASSVMSYLLIRLAVFRGRRKVTLLAILGFVFLLGLAVSVAFYFSPIDKYYPLFTPEDLSPGEVGSIVWGSIDVILGLFLLVIGVASELLRRRFAIILWFLVGYLFINSGHLGVPFFQYRFTEFISLPLLILALLGLHRLVMAARGKVFGVLLLALVAATSLPFQLQQQNNVRACHIHYCPGLHPVLILDDDRRAYEWLRDNTPAGSIVIGVPKFGIFIPALGLRGVLFPYKSTTITNDAYHVLTAESQETRWRHAVAAGAGYIVWDAALSRYGKSYKPYQKLTERFDDSRYFEKVYDQNDVRIYRVVINE